ncbi:unnamed protein product [Calicophoron daubneyi]|uniref:Uncharacterized protein n=1 Tax=Calicophoron daubneyi TaxID=300641 RepID=A0AAV2T1Z8_CALDB
MNNRRLAIVNPLLPQTVKPGGCEVSENLCKQKSRDHSFLPNELNPNTVHQYDVPSCEPGDLGSLPPKTILDHHTQPTLPSSRGFTDNPGPSYHPATGLRESQCTYIPPNELPSYTSPAIYRTSYSENTESWINSPDLTFVRSRFIGLQRIGQP